MITWFRYFKCIKGFEFYYSLNMKNAVSSNFSSKYVRHLIKIYICLKPFKSLNETMNIRE